MGQVDDWWFELFVSSTALAFSNSNFRIMLKLTEPSNVFGPQTTCRCIHVVQPFVLRGFYVLSSTIIFTCFSLYYSSSSAVMNPSFPIIVIDVFRTQLINTNEYKREDKNKYQNRRYILPVVPFTSSYFLYNQQQIGHINPWRVFIPN